MLRLSTTDTAPEGLMTWTLNSGELWMEQPGTSSEIVRLTLGINFFEEPCP